MSAQQSFRSLPLRMLWLEITNRCNEQCSHCYNDSGPHRRNDRVLSFADWLEALNSAARLGCERVQFIGGEPTLVPELPQLIEHARSIGIPHIEVFTNATAITNRLLTCFVENGVEVAVSLYGHEASGHDRITVLPGSFLKTVDALKRMHAAGVPLRVGVIRMADNEHVVERTMEFVRSLGIESVGSDHARAFGRAEALTGRKTELSELCGQCWNGSLCVLPNGDVSPCIMSRQWPIGSLRNSTLEEIVQSLELDKLRRRIHDEVWLPKNEQACAHAGDSADEGQLVGVGAGETKACGPGPCYPGPTCSPKVCYPGSGPCSPACSPQICGPGTGPCYPIRG